MCSLEKRIRDLINFYVKENYNNYLKTNNLKTIETDKIQSVVDELYTAKKKHIQEFVKDSLKLMLKDEMPKEYIINNLLSEIFRDDELCKNRLTQEINIHQQKVSNGHINYKKI
jgi:hypothetical protein|tara:strand:+ start:225 stop:566 length:342 start_codon:yes stop_codon:yes gene_type:complete